MNKHCIVSVNKHGIVSVNKRGSAIAEAAIVFPVVIIVLLTVIYILITLYVDASTDARDHLALRKEAGKTTELVIREDDFSNIKPADKFGRKPFTESVEITEDRRFVDKTLSTERGRVYVIDEVTYIRRVDLLGELLGDTDDGD